MEQRESNEGRSMREVLPAAGNGSLTLPAEGLVRRRPSKESLSNRGGVVSAPFSASGDTEKCCSAMEAALAPALPMRDEYSVHYLNIGSKWV